MNKNLGMGPAPIGITDLQASINEPINETDLFNHFTNLAAENENLKRELEITKQLITKGVLDSHSYILGYGDGKASMQSEIEILKQSLRESNAEDE